MGVVKNVIIIGIWLMNVACYMVPEANFRKIGAYGNEMRLCHSYPMTVKVGLEYDAYTLHFGLFSHSHSSVSLS